MIYDLVLINYKQLPYDAMIYIIGKTNYGGKVSD